MGRGLIARLLRGRPSEPGEPVPDAELLARFARAGDEAAFELLVWRHAVMVAGVCRRIVRDEHLAEDAFQAAFLVLARKAGSVRGANLAGWLFRVARRVSLRARGQAAARRRRETPLTTDPPADPAPPPTEHRELLALLDEEIARLPERFRLPVLLCYLGGRSVADAARVLGCPRGTVLSRLATARERLAARLTRRGVTLPTAGLAAVVATPSLSAVAGLVPRVVPAAVAFARVRPPRGVDPVPNSFVLAEGVVRAMSASKLAAVAGMFLLAVGLVSGFGLVAADAQQPGGTAKAEPPKPAEKAAAPAGQPKAEPPKPAEKAAAPAGQPKADPDRDRQIMEERRRRDEQIRKLEEVAQALTLRIKQQEEALRLGEANLAHDLFEQRGKLEAAEDLFTIEKEAARAKVVRLTKELAEWEEGNKKGNTDPDSPNMKARLAETARVADELAKAKAAYRELVLKHHRETAPSRRAVEDAGREHPQVATIRADLALDREMLARVQRQLMSLRFGLDQPTAGPGGSDPGPNDILRELRELRREVRELKKP